MRFGVAEKSAASAMLGGLETIGTLQPISATLERLCLADQRLTRMNGLGCVHSLSLSLSVESHHDAAFRQTKRCGFKNPKRNFHPFPAQRVAAAAS